MVGTKISGLTGGPSYCQPGGARCGARQPLFYASRASRRLCFKEGRDGSRSCGTAESTAGGTSPSDMVPYLRMLVVGDIRARSYATGQQSLGDETTDLARRSDTECCSTLRHRRVPRAALNLAEYTSRYHPASRRSGCLICRKDTHISAAGGEPVCAS